MTVISATYTTIDGAEASEGRAGRHTVVADRPDRVAGGRGLGFNGGQLFALAVGGCLCNDLRYAAHRTGRALGPFDVAVDVELGDGGDVVDVRVRVDAREDRDTLAALLEGAVQESTIIRAVMRGAPVDVALS